MKSTRESNEEKITINSFDHFIILNFIYECLIFIIYFAEIFDQSSIKKSIHKLKITLKITLK
jgi:hypothetical protein